MGKTFETNEDFLTDRFVSELTDIGLNSAKGVQIRSDVELNESMEYMERFLEMDASEPTGFEFVYDHVGEQTYMNILAESDESSLYHEFSDLNNVNMVQDYDLLQNLTEDSYVAGAKIELGNDYWHSLQTEKDHDFDPLRKLMYEMSKEGDSNVTTALQATIQPIPNNQWNKRYSFQGLFGRLAFLPLSMPLYMFNLIISVSDKTRAQPAEAMKRIGSEFGKIINRLTGYSRSDFIEYYKMKAENVKGNKDMNSIFDGIGTVVDKMESKIMFGRTKDNISISNTDNDRLSNDLDEVVKLAKDKSESKGYATSMRLILIGDDEKEVSEKIDNLKETYETIYNVPENDASVQQRLVVKPIKSEEKMKELVIDVGQRKTSVNNQGEIRDEYEWKAIKTTRTKPMVLTPAELSQLIHVPSDKVSDKSIDKRDINIEEGIDDEYVYDID